MSVVGYVLVGIGLIVVGLSLFSRRQRSPAWFTRLLTGLVIIVSGIYWILKIA